MSLLIGNAARSISQRGAKAALAGNPTLKAWYTLMISTETIGSIPRPRDLLDATAQMEGTDSRLAPLYEKAARGPVKLFEETGSLVIAHVEARKFHQFWTFAPLCGDISTTRDLAFAAICSRVRSAAWASRQLGVAQ